LSLQNLDNHVQLTEEITSFFSSHPCSLCYRS